MLLNLPGHAASEIGMRRHLSSSQLHVTQPLASSRRPSCQQGAARPSPLRLPRPTRRCFDRRDSRGHLCRRPPPHCWHRYLRARSHTSSSMVARPRYWSRSQPTCPPTPSRSLWRPLPTPHRLHRPRSPPQASARSQPKLAAATARRQSSCARHARPLRCRPLRVGLRRARKRAAAAAGRRAHQTQWAAPPRWAHRRLLLPSSSLAARPCATSSEPAVARRRREGSRERRRRTDRTEGAHRRRRRVPPPLPLGAGPSEPRRKAPSGRMS